MDKMISLGALEQRMGESFWEKRCPTKIQPFSQKDCIFVGHLFSFLAVRILSGLYDSAPRPS